MHLTPKESELFYFTASDQLELAIKNFDEARAALQMAREGIITPQGPNADCSVECDAYGKALRELGVAIALEEKAEYEWKMKGSNN